ncbi:nucleoside/nucleotide kinase family protein [Streptomyces sp. NPDC093261]|uniref:nucleoside/nucleotide kinase family protein n=1 Tax=Streptomyces sp. NPDC093261 TaxID=3366037 RepID=UPI00382F3F18
MRAAQGVVKATFRRAPTRGRRAREPAPVPRGLPGVAAVGRFPTLAFPCAPVVKWPDPARRTGGLPTTRQRARTPMTFDDLLKRAASLGRPGRRAILGIAGSPGAGKTTLAEHLVRKLNGDGTPWVAHVPMDGFHLADAELDRLGRRERKGAPDTFDAAGYAALLRRLGEETDGETVYAPGFERVLEQPLAGAIPVPASARLVVTEGNYLLLETGAWARVRPLLDEVWFCEIDEPERVRRLVARHEEFGKDHETAVAWVGGTDQRNADLVARTRHRADLVVPAEALPTAPEPPRARRSAGRP